MATSTDFITPKPYGEEGAAITETLMGLLYITCMIVGLPTNITSVIYFSRQKSRDRSTREFFKYIYVNIAGVDLCICIFAFPMIDVFFFDPSRNGVLFSNSSSQEYTLFCKVWGFLWEVLPYYSVYLVLVLSISRMMILVYPMTVLSKRYLLIGLGLYNILLILIKVAFYMGNVTMMIYSKRDGMCILSYVPDNEELYPIYTFFNIILLACPIIPICISCICSLLRLYRTNQAVMGTRKVSNNLMRRVSIRKSQGRHRRATVTVIIMTITYIVCNLPVFLNYVFYGYWSVMRYVVDDPDDPDGTKLYQSLYSSPLMFYYSWNITLVLMVVVNAMLNPIIYVLRMKEFRQFVVNKCNAIVREHNHETSISLS